MSGGRRRAYLFLPVSLAPTLFELPASSILTRRRSRTSKLYSGQRRDPPETGITVSSTALSREVDAAGSTAASPSDPPIRTTRYWNRTQSSATILPKGQPRPNWAERSIDLSLKAVSQSISCPTKWRMDLGGQADKLGTTRRRLSAELLSLDRYCSAVRSEEASVPA